MADIISIQDYRLQQIEQKGFGPWRKRFGESFHRNTCLADISDDTLLRLAQPGESQALPYYELIMGVLNWGNPVKFYYLDDTERMRVIDIHLFLADQVRFEMMKRLGWVETFAGEGRPLIEFILAFERMRTICMNQPPTLSALHPRYPEYCNLVKYDRQVFIRRLLPEALDQFQQRAAPK